MTGSRQNCFGDFAVLNSKYSLLILGYKRGAADKEYFAAPFCFEIGKLAGGRIHPGDTHGYATRDRIAGLTVNGPGGLLASYTQNFSPSGRKTNVLEGSGRTENYGYDSIYRLLSENVSGDPTAANNGALSYMLDPVGNRQTLSSTVAALPGQSFTYDNDDRLNADTYDSNGNTLASHGVNYTYDFRDRLITASLGWNSSQSISTRSTSALICSPARGCVSAVRSCDNELRFGQSLESAKRLPAPVKHQEKTMQIGGGWVRLVLSVSATGTLVLGATWTEIDAGLPRTPVGVGAVVVDPSSPSTLYALARSLFKSTDGGGTWSVIRNISSVSALVIDPSDSSKLYAVDLGTVVKSTDGGQSWANTGTGPGIFGLAIDPRNTSTLYTMSSTAILKTADGGATWSPKTMGLPTLLFAGLYGGLFGGSFAIDPVNPSAVFAAVGNGLYKSTDGGESWRGPMVQSGVCRNCPVAIDPAHPSTIYAVLLTPGNFGGTLGGDPTNLFKSTDGGENWKLANLDIGPDEVVSLVVDGASAVYIAYARYAFNGATSYGLAKSADGGAKWNNINTGLPLDASYSLALNAADPSTIFAIGSGGVFRTVDGGSHWSLMPSAGLSVLDVRALAIDPADPSTVYAAAGDGVSKRNGGGADWSTVHFPAPFGGTAIVPSLMIDPNNPTVLYASVLSTGGCSSGDPFLLKSTDGGATWNDLGVTSCADGPVSFAMDPNNSNTLYLAPYDDADCGTPLDMTTDGGTSWNQTYIGGFVTALAAGPGNPATLYAGLTYSGGILKSADSGKTWVSTGLRDVDVNVLALDPRNSNILYAGTSMGLFKTTDGGATWSAINSALAGIIPTSAGITALVIDSQFSVLYMGTSGGGVLRSIDGGRRWTAINDGLTNLDVRALAVSSDGSGTIYAATSAGVFTMVDQREDKHRTVR